MEKDRDQRSRLLKTPLPVSLTKFIRGISE